MTLPIRVSGSKRPIAVISQLFGNTGQDLYRECGKNRKKWGQRLFFRDIPEKRDSVLWATSLFHGAKSSCPEKGRRLDVQGSLQ